MLRPASRLFSSLSSSVAWMKAQRFTIVLNLALLGAVLFLIFTDEGMRILAFHLVFLLLTLGALYWRLPTFIGQSIIWLAITTVVLVISVMHGTMASMELMELPILSSILMVVALISRQRRRAEQALRAINQELEKRVMDRTIELSRLNDELLQEIAERKQVEHNLREVSARTQALVDIVPDSFIDLDRAGNVLAFRGAEGARDLLSAIESGSRLDGFLPPDLVEPIMLYMNRALDTGEVQVFTYQHVPPAREKDFEIRLVVSGGDKVLAIVRDITSTATLDRERKRTFRHLHDGVGQILGFLHLRMEVLLSRKTLPKAADLRSEIAQMHDAVNDAYDMIRGIMAAAHPANTNDLETALMLEAKLMASQHHFKVNFTRAGDYEPLSPVVQREVLFICKEALANIAKHAGAKSVDVALNWREDALIVTLTDNGRGFVPGAPAASGHYGLSIMRERAGEIHGDLQIASTVGTGTELTLRVPLSRCPQRMSEAERRTETE